MSDDDRLAVICWLIICFTLGFVAGVSLDISVKQLESAEGICENLHTKLLSMDMDEVTCEDGSVIEYVLKEEKK
jgi:hypothetical protein